MEILLTVALVLVFAVSTYVAEYMRYKKKSNTKKGPKAQTKSPAQSKKQDATPTALLGVVYPGKDLNAN